ncbi:MAG: chitobiase/beta-hexosaminidase C-terminal domain-containing protein [Clostridium sp.]|nr:chitobiase/beta-hexosaminidase C-terminal domain-containing protein [Clostridium sp.]
MKKLLLLATLLLALGLSANAETLKFVMKDIYGGSTISDIAVTDKEWSSEYGEGKVLVTLVKQTGASNGPAYNKDGDVRLYAKNTITIKSTTTLMTKIEFLISAQGKKRYCPVTASVGTIETQTPITTTNKTETHYLTWTGAAQEVTFTVGDQASLGTDGASKQGQLDFDNLYVTFSEAAAAVKSPEFSMSSGEYKKSVEVEITCPTEGVSIYYTTNGDEPTNASTLYDGAITLTETTTIKAVAYKGADKSAMSVATYTILSVYNSIESLMTLGDNAKFFYDGDLTVVYVNGASNYVYDGTNYLLVYLFNSGWNAKDVLKGEWTGSVDIYNGLFEVKPSTTPTVDGTAELPAPMEITAGNYTASLVSDNFNKYCLLKGLVLDEASPATKTAFTGKLGDNSVSFFNNFTVAAQDAGTYDVLCFMSVNDKDNNSICTDTSKMQFYPISYTEVKTDGIEGVEVDANAPVIYYNLSGIRISNPAEGDVVIRVQGGKATKIRF